MFLCYLKFRITGLHRVHITIYFICYIYTHIPGKSHICMINTYMPVCVYVILTNVYVIL